MAKTAIPQLPELIDKAGLEREIGVKRAGAEAIFRQLPKVQIPGLDKIYVYRRDVDKLIAENTIDDINAAARRRRAA